MENLVHLFNNAIGWSILHSLWQAAAIYIILLGIYLIFYKMSSHHKYILGFTAQLLVFLCFAFTINKYLQFSALQSKTLLIPEQEQLILYLEYLQNSSWSISQFLPYIAGLYTIGLLVQVFLCIQSFRQLNRIRKSSTTAVPLLWEEKLKSIVSRYKIANIKLLVSEYVTSPITIGFVKPLIIIPTAYINKISLQDAEAILLHEVAHIKRYDYLFNIVLISIETILFFNPFVWLISRHIKIEREQSCDDFVTDSHISPLDYSRTLLQIEVLRQGYIGNSAMALTGNNKYDLFTRIKRINNKVMETKYTAFKHQTIAVLCALLAFLFVAWVNPNQEPINEGIEKEVKTQKILPENTVDEPTPPADPKPAKRKHIILKKDTSIIVLNNEEEVQELTKKLEKDLKALDEEINSPEWRKKIKSLEVHTKNLDQHFNSPEWREKVIRLETDAEKLRSQINSPEWKEKIESMEKKALKVQKYFETPEWKEKVKSLEERALEIQKHFDSDEWKDKIAQVEANSRLIHKKLNSGEWQQKLKEMDGVIAFYNSKELRKMNEQYKKKIEDLKKQKGIK